MVKIETTRKKTKKYGIDEGKCDNCGKCIELCCVDAIIMDDDQTKIISSKCINCGYCIDNCPNGAIFL